MTIYKVLDINAGVITLVLELDEHNHEVIEELEVPEGEDPYDYLTLMLDEVHLGTMCEQRRRYT